MSKYGIFGIPLAVILLCLFVSCSVAIYRLFRVTDGGSSLAAAVDGLSWPAAGLLLSIVFVAATHPLIRGLATGIWDADGAYFPYFTLVSDHAKAGQFVTWDLWTNGGSPAMGDPQFGHCRPSFSPLACFRSTHHKPSLHTGWLAGGWEASVCSFSGDT